MQNDAYLILIGNGFDLAHELKTSYNDFLHYAVNLNLSNNKLDDRLFSKKIDLSIFSENYDDIINDVRKNLGDEDYNYHNELFRTFLSDLALYNWCDLEDKYFNIIKIIGKEFIKKTNEEFEEIKKYLSDYLLKQQSLNSGRQSDSYSFFFKHLKKRNYKIVNFNYTNTLNQYSKEIKKESIIQLHGELENEMNPMIFGYAANDEESRELNNRKENEFSRNIKKHCYKRSNKEKELTDFLKKSKKIEVLVFGHSFGESDKLILNQILNNEKVEKIRLFYFEEHQNFFDQQVNMDRIMNNDVNFNKLINFQDSHRMPQLNDDIEKIEAFKDYIAMNINGGKDTYIPSTKFHSK